MRDEEGGEGVGGQGDGRDLDDLPGLAWCKAGWHEIVGVHCLMIHSVGDSNPLAMVA